jgi:hypothetical protein
MNGHNEECPQLLGMQPPIALPPNQRQRMLDGWALIDGGEFAVHVMSKEARERYFSHHYSSGAVESPLAQ